MATMTVNSWQTELARAISVGEFPIGFDYKSLTAFRVLVDRVEGGDHINTWGQDSTPVTGVLAVAACTEIRSGLMSLVGIMDIPDDNAAAWREIITRCDEQEQQWERELMQAPNAYEAIMVFVQAMSTRKSVEQVRPYARVRHRPEQRRRADGAPLQKVRTPQKYTQTWVQVPGQAPGICNAEGSSAASHLVCVVDGCWTPCQIDLEGNRIRVGPANLRVVTGMLRRMDLDEFGSLGLWRQVTMEWWQFRLFDAGLVGFQARAWPRGPENMRLNKQLVGDSGSMPPTPAMIAGNAEQQRWLQERNRAVQSIQTEGGIAILCNLADPDWTTGQDTSQVAKWLARHGLQSFTSGLQRAGYEQVESLVKDVDKLQVNDCRTWGDGTAWGGSTTITARKFQQLRQALWLKRDGKLPQWALEAEQARSSALGGTDDDAAGQSTMHATFRQERSQILGNAATHDTCYFGEELRVIPRVDKKTVLSQGRAGKDTGYLEVIDFATMARKGVGMADLRPGAMPSTCDASRGPLLHRDSMVVGMQQRLIAGTVTNGQFNVFMYVREYERKRQRPCMNMLVLGFDADKACGASGEATKLATLAAAGLRTSPPEWASEVLEACEGDLSMAATIIIDERRRCSRCNVTERVQKRPRSSEPAADDQGAPDAVQDGAAKLRQAAIDVWENRPNQPYKELYGPQDKADTEFDAELLRSLEGSSDVETDLHRCNRERKEMSEYMAALRARKETEQIALKAAASMKEETKDTPREGDQA